MTRDEIIETAVKAGMHIDILTLGRNVELLEAFAKLVAQHEREACANVCDDDAWRCKKIAVDTQNKQANASAIEASICASAIRARGQA